MERRRLMGKFHAGRSDPTAFIVKEREAEVLYWVAKGKTNRDIGDIFGTSHTTVKKHLKHVFEKLGVETLNAAASMAASRVRGVVEAN